MLDICEIHRHSLGEIVRSMDYLLSISAKGFNKMSQSAIVTVYSNENYIWCLLIKIVGIFILSIVVNVLV